MVSKLIELNPLSNGWEKIGQAVLSRPRRLWGWTMALMIPFAAVGVLSWNHLSYGLMSELPSTDASVVGAKAIQGHFPEGTAGPLTVLLANDQMNFKSSEAKDKIAELVSSARSVEEARTVFETLQKTVQSGKKSAPQSLSEAVTNIQHRNY